MGVWDLRSTLMAVTSESHHCDCKDVIIRAWFVGFGLLGIG